MEPGNVKALLRRAYSREYLGDSRGKAEDLEAAFIQREAIDSGADGSCLPALAEVPLSDGVIPAVVSVRLYSCNFVPGCNDVCCILSAPAHITPCLILCTHSWYHPLATHPLQQPDASKRARITPHELSNEDAVMLRDMAVGKSEAKPLGQGASNVVYRLCGLAIRFPLSLTEAQSELSGPSEIPDAYKAFDNEVSIMAELNGCSAAPILYAFHRSSRTIVMEFFEGGSLADKMRHPGNWDTEYWHRMQCSTWLLEGLDKLQSHLGKGRVIDHGDIKVRPG